MAAAAGDAALQAGGDGMNVLRQTQTVTGHARPQMLHAARYSHHGLGACRFHQRLVDMPATWEQLCDPDAQSRNNDKGSPTKRKKPVPSASRPRREG